MRPLPEQWRFEAIGTGWQIDTAVALGESDRAAVQNCLDSFDRRWSRFRGDGDIAALRTGASVDFGPDASPLLALYDRLYELTAGAINPLIGGGLEMLGYDANYRLRPSGAPTPAPQWTLARREGAVLTVPPGAVLDIGAVGKGYLVDLVAEVLADRGHRSVIDAGGDLLNASDDPVRVALEHPDDATMAVGVLELAPGRAVCGSAVNRRAWGEGLHHVLDARTGRPITGVVATWAVAGSAAVADAAATAAFFVRPSRLTDDPEWPRTEVVVIDRTGAVSAAFTGEVFA
ncbi:FAD:protein FMN transferase [Nocardia mangyaensis]|uniref:FAD:protein FMN transferase n=1 Tax=Nocardia mangyaensis TaxID=2213200 RepID=UPI0026771D8D|nr:FAD:protein FMN transferase [Nocardia mangyaensis]MDO3648622.1 FAD:protein FMN transferase [Nocardia mangyaensis]